MLALTERLCFVAERHKGYLQCRQLFSLYVYRLRIFEPFGRKPKSFDDALLSEDLNDQISGFINKNQKIKQDHDRQRTWFFDPPSHNEDGEYSGLIRYGTFGFESELIDTKTKQKQYDRKSSDFEQIALYYQFWLPEGEDFGLVAFQAFSGRSCISYVRAALQESFRKKNKGLTLRFEKITPVIVNKATFANSNVNQVTLIKRSSSSDLADLHGASKAPNEVEIEIKISAKSGNFGKFRDLSSESLRKSPGIYAIGSSPFQKATATVDFNGKARRVGIFGDTGNAGAFDVTEDITFGSNGHPDYSSIDSMADELLQDCYDALT